MNKKDMLEYIKLVSGDDIIAKIEERTEDGFFIKYPLFVSSGNIDSNHMGYYFSPWIPLDLGDPIFMKNSSVICSYEPNKVLKKMYYEILLDTIEETRITIENLERSEKIGTGNKYIN